jgi:hypothetical protein
VGSSQYEKLGQKNGYFMRTCFRMMGEFYRDLFNKGVRGKKVSRNYSKHMQEFADLYFSKEFADL